MALLLLIRKLDRLIKFQLFFLARDAKRSDTCLANFTGVRMSCCFVVSVGTRVGNSTCFLVFNLVIFID